MGESIVQAVLFKNDGWDLRRSMKWLEDNHFKAKKVDITKNYFRFRIHEPYDLKQKGFTHYANKTIEDKDIILVISYK